MKEFERLDSKEYILIKGARLHNLKNIDLAIPRNKFVVITGLSGSGKSFCVRAPVFLVTRNCFRPCGGCVTGPWRGSWFIATTSFCF